MENILKYLVPIGLSMIPISELRGGIPAAFINGLEWYEAYALCCLANFLPIPFILLFIAKILEWMRASKFNFIRKVAAWLDKKVDKNEKKINSYGFFGLMLFVAIPLPMTGAWTGSLVAGVTKMKFKRAILSVALGILVAGAIVTFLMYGGATGLDWLKAIFVKM